MKNVQMEKDIDSNGKNCYIRTTVKENKAIENFTDNRR
jgi:hypothetical protein